MAVLGMNLWPHVDFAFFKPCRLCRSQKQPKTYAQRKLLTQIIYQPCGISRKAISSRKELLQNLRSMKAKLQHVWHWKEMDDGQELTMQLYDTLMKEAGVGAEKADESLAGVKGQLAARSHRAKAK